MALETQGERLAALEARMIVVEAGVSNFRNFQSKVSKFVDDHEAREDERDRTDKRRARIHFALLGMLLTIVSGCAIALFTWVLDGHHTVSHGPVAQNTTQDAGATSTHF